MQERTCRTVEELDELLDQLALEYAGDRAIITKIELDTSGDSLTIGLGRDMSVLEHMRSSLDPPYLMSVGDHDKKGEVVFFLDGEATEIARSNLVPTSLAREAVRRFATTGELLDRIRWEEV